MTDKERLIWASGFYLTDHFTEELLNGSNALVDEFISENLWVPFEYWSADDVFEQIQQLANSLRSILVSNNIGE
jgi:DNA replication protein DnaC